MIRAIGYVLVSLMSVSIFLRLKSWSRRTQWKKRVNRADVIRLEQRVPMKVLLMGSALLPGMHPTRVNRTRGDLVMTKNRFLMTSNRGMLVDLGPHSGRYMTSARCTGPQRLVIEGNLVSSTGKQGSYRFECVVGDGVVWSQLLEKYIQQPEGQSVKSDSFSSES